LMLHDENFHGARVARKGRKAIWFVHQLCAYSRPHYAAQGRAP
jgi:hypothetical protein